MTCDIMIIGQTTYLGSTPRDPGVFMHHPRDDTFGPTAGCR